MQITIVSVEDKGKKLKYKTSDNKTYNAWKDKLEPLLPNTTYDIEFTEEPYDNPVTKKTVMMKWIHKAVTAGADGATSAVGSSAQPTVAVSAPASAMSKGDWIEKERRSTRTMILSYAKDFAIGYMGVEKNKLVDEEHFIKVIDKVYKHMVELLEVEK